MSSSPNDLFLGVTTHDGSVYTTDRASGSGTWSAFQSIPALTQPGRKNLAVTVTSRRQVAAINDSAIRQLRYTRESGGWPTPVRLAVGVSPAHADVADDSFSLAVLAIGTATQAGSSFGLPLFLLGADEKTVLRLVDQITGIAPGNLSPGDRATELDISGTFNDREKSFHLCLTTRSGKTFHTYKDGTKLAQFQQIPYFGHRVLRDVSCSPGREGLHVCGVTDAGRILHVIRRPDGSWSSTGDVSTATRSSDLFQQISISHYDAPGRGGVLHVIGITRAGGLLHAMRTAEETADPLWTSFVDVKALAGDKGPVTSVDIGVTA